ncbi:MAG TPA: DUF4340 domain-containing protein [Candidatus Krumholzibacteria bacterium]|nr:DUF4340 domain-containing protein [Candidatus Krumholzibacteria bacterium]HPD72545.1 DUF4340 domain-containing protein [Candidatus Krumholzibacteria bacterium]HRY40523.1 DUF4340 domain-containing protein [Candidatus Krumholzibacteria bacterium]
MLNRNILMVLGGILIVLIVISVAQTRCHREATSRPSSEVLLPGEFARADLGRLVIGYGAESDAVVLEQTPEGWRVATAWNARAADQRLDTLLQSLSDLRGEFRSSSEEVLADYGFTDTTTITISGFHPDGGEAFAIELGGAPSGSQGNFVKKPGASDVYLTTQNVRGNLGLWGASGRPASRHFLELQAYKVDRQEVDAIQLRGEEAVDLVKEFAMVEPAPDDSVHTGPYSDRSQWEWRLERPGGKTLGQAVKTKADGVLGAAVNLRAQDVADPGAGPAAYGLDAPERQVTLVLAGGQRATLAFGATREAEGTAPGGCYAQVEGDPTIWVVGEYAVNNLFKTPKDLLPE